MVVSLGNRPSTNTRASARRLPFSAAAIVDPASSPCLHQNGPDLGPAAGLTNKKHARVELDYITKVERPPPFEAPIPCLILDWQGGGSRRACGQSVLITALRLVHVRTRWVDGSFLAQVSSFHASRSFAISGSSPEKVASPKMLQQQDLRPPLECENTEHSGNHSGFVSSG